MTLDVVLHEGIVGFPFDILRPHGRLLRMQRNLMRGKVVHPQQLNQEFFNRFMHDQIAADSALILIGLESVFPGWLSRTSKSVRGDSCRSPKAVGRRLQSGQGLTADQGCMSSVAIAEAPEATTRET